MFIPGFILGLCGACCVILAIAMAYAGEHRALGHTLLAAAIAFVPLFFFVWIKVLSRFVTRHERQMATVTPEGRAELKGKQGVSLTTLRPSGTARVDGQRVDVVARGEIIEANTRIEVIAVEGNRVVVKQIQA